ncbi:hypothetical protein ACFL6C_14380, partial [Myxococcota bacterium]
MSRAVVALLSVLVSWPGSASASQEASVSLTDTLTIEGRTNINRLNLVGSAGDVAANLRVDSTTFVEPPLPEHEPDLRLERIAV